MHVITETHGNLTCDMEASGNPNSYHATLKYKGYEQGRFSGKSISALQENFKAICGYIDAGGIVRSGILLTGYFHEPYNGDVMTIDGEALGSWHMDEMETSFFILTGQTDHELEAPSPWMLHDYIVEWYEEH